MASACSYYLPPAGPSPGQGSFHGGPFECIQFDLVGLRSIDLCPRHLLPVEVHDERSANVTIAQL